MSNQGKRNGPSHMASKNSGRNNSRSSGQSRQVKSASRRHSSQGGRFSKEPLQDNYYYEEPAGNHRSGAREFEDISSYSSERRRREDKSVQKKRGKGSAKKKVAVARLVFLALIGAGLYYVFGYMLGGLTMKTITKDKNDLGIHSEAQTDQSIKNIALFGLDARENEDEGRSDALMILTVDNKHGKLKLTSILRDSEVNIDGYGSDKITHAYAYGGPELSIKTLNQNFHLDIEDYVTVNFIQMAEIVDAFGGTQVSISYDEMNEINTNLAMLQAESNDANVLESDYMYEDGDVLLNGNQAVAYARIRHLEGGDDMRANRQQNVLKGLIEQLKGKSKLEYPELIHRVMPMCETSLDFADIMGMSPIMFTDFTMETLSLPGEEENAYGDFNEEGRWVYLYDIELAAQHLNRFLYEEDSPYYNSAAAAKSTAAEHKANSASGRSESENAGGGEREGNTDSIDPGFYGGMENTDGNGEGGGDGDTGVSADDSGSDAGDFAESSSPDDADGGETNGDSGENTGDAVDADNDDTGSVDGDESGNADEYGDTWMDE